MDTALHSLLYLSSAVVRFTPEQLEELLLVCRAHNSGKEITGLLLYRDGCFMQLLEGPGDEVQALYRRIQDDRRHEDVKTLDEGPIRARDFPDWSMGFRDLQSTEVKALPGFSDFLDTPLTAAELEGRLSHARSLLLTFKSQK